jgi:TonB family protein
MARRSKRKVPTMRFFGQAALLSALATLFSLVAVTQKREETAPTNRATLVNLEQPVYPPLARQAHIDGEVIVTVTVHPDGKAGAALESGHPMLAQAALDSARRSQFECRGCESAVPCQLVYSFRLTRGGDCCSALSVTPQVTQEPQPSEQNGTRQTHIAITAEAICLCDPAAHLTKKIRTVKCLYLWRCS